MIVLYRDCISQFHYHFDFFKYVKQVNRAIYAPLFFNESSPRFRPFQHFIGFFWSLVCVGGGSERGLHVKQQCAQY